MEEWWALISSRVATLPSRGWEWHTRPRPTSNLHLTPRTNVSKASTPKEDHVQKLMRGTWELLVRGWGWERCSFYRRMNLSWFWSLFKMLGIWNYVNSVHICNSRAIEGMWRNSVPTWRCSFYKYNKICIKMWKGLNINLSRWTVSSNFFLPTLGFRASKCCNFYHEIWIPNRLWTPGIKGSTLGSLLWVTVYISYSKFFEIDAKTHK